MCSCVCVCCQPLARRSPHFASCCVRVAFCSCACVIDTVAVWHLVARLQLWTCLPRVCQGQAAEFRCFDVCTPHGPERRRPDGEHDRADVLLHLPEVGSLGGAFSRIYVASMVLVVMRAYYSVWLSLVSRACLCAYTFRSRTPGAVAGGLHGQVVDQRCLPGAPVQELHRLPRVGRRPAFLLELG